MWRTPKPKTFLVRQDVDRGVARWQIGQDVIGDQSFYTRDFAIRCFDKLTKRGLTAVFEGSARSPHEVV